MKMPIQYFWRSVVLVLVLLATSACTQVPTMPPESPRRAATGADRAPAGPNVFVMLSGGASPTSNNYSQYLQARAVVRFFEQNYPADSIWTFFGAGNIEGQAPFFGDVRRQVKQEGLILETWLPGPISRNRPAKREVVLKAFREEILPAVRDGGTLFLFVGDHGSLSRGEHPECQIDLWGIDPDPGSVRGWKSVNHEKLTVSDLQGVLREGLGRGRVVFCMTQCYSGGFHFLGIGKHMQPNPAWFARPPARPAAPPAAPLPLAAGYTAADHYSLAAGCDPDPDPDKWAGYERFVPENLLGLDLFTLAPAGVRRASFHEAHIEATLVDKTIDKPHATSERYLERWATLIETTLAESNELTPKAKRAVAAYRQAVETGKVRPGGELFRERVALFARFTARLTEQNPAVKPLLLTGTRAELEKAAGPLPPTAHFRAAPPASAAGSASLAATAERRKLWKDTIRPAWKAAVEAGTIPALAHPAALAFEKVLLAEEDKGRDLMFATRSSSPLLGLTFWNSGSHRPDTVDPVRAEAVARWGAQRRNAVIAWARASADESVRTTADKVFPRSNRPAAAPAALGERPAAEPVRSNVSTRPLTPKTAAERVLLYRRVLAAWAFLETMKETPALDQVARFTELERTPLPAPTRG
jgi:hypothetical protein